MRSRASRLSLVLITAAAVILLACGGDVGKAEVMANHDNQQTSEAASPAPTTMPRITDIVAAQIYWGFGYGLPERQSKFVVLFDKMFGAAGTDNIASMYAEGPDGYRLEIKNQPYTYANGNGYLEEAMFNNYRWFMAFDRRGFLEDGTYTVTVEYKNGEESQMSRTLQYDDSLLSFYLANKDRIVFSPTTVGNPAASPVDVSASQSPLEVKWTTLDSLGGPDAYYCLRIAEDTGSGWGTQAVFDNIFDASSSTPTAGLDKGSFSVTEGLKPNSSYLWFTEICDSNHYRDINVCIFQPLQQFTTR
jgi:hypothetical protein